MAKYGTFKYGSGTKYGYGTAVSLAKPTGEVAWILNIDWTGNGWVNEAGNLQNLDLFQGSEHYIDFSGSGIETFEPGKATLTMVNTDRRYDPYNSDSPLYPYILPGRPVQISVFIVATGEKIDLFNGYISDIQPVSGREEVTITAEDGLRELDTDVSMGLLYAGTVSECINMVLDAAGWKGPRFIETVNQPVQVFNPERGNALAIIHDLASANLGTFFVDRAGMACFYPIAYQAPLRSFLSQDQILREIRIPQPWETVRNAITVMANQRGRQSRSVIWSLGRVVKFEAGETISFGQTFDLADGISQPMPYEDYLANTAANGSGTDVTGDFAVSFTEVKSSESDVGVTNNSGGVAYLRKLRLVGQKIVTCAQSFKSEDGASVLFYKRRTFKLDNPWLQDRNFANTYAEWLKDFLKDPQKNLVIQIEQRPAIQFKLWLMDRVNLSSSKLTFSLDRHIRGIRHEWHSETGQSVLTTVYLQNLLYNATVITEDPYIPGEPLIPEVPTPDLPPDYDPYIPPVPVPPDFTDMCLWNDAGITGPYSLAFSKAGLSNRANDPAVMESFIWYPCTLRKSGAVNRSYIIINATFWNELPTLKFDNGNAWWHVDAIDGNKVVKCSGVISAGVDAFHRRVEFAPATPVEVAGFRIWLETKEKSYGLGDTVASGTITVTESGGDTISGLTAGLYYALEGTGGPWLEQSSKPNQQNWMIDIFPNLTWCDIGGDDYQGYQELDPGGDVIKVEHHINIHYSRGYFIAAGTSCKIRVSDINFADNGGSMGYILKQASGTGPRTLSLISGQIFNVCGTGIL